VFRVAATCLRIEKSLYAVSAAASTLGAWFISQPDP
jgi:hypothetical protein